MEVLARGEGRLFTDPSADALRAVNRERSRVLTDRVTDVRDAVARLIHDGDFFATGGFGTNRIPTAIIHELLRQGRRGLGFSGHTTTHDFQLLCAGHRKTDTLARLDAAYVVGLEARGLSPQARRVLESGEVEVTEWSNYTLAVRYQAAALGVPFLPARSLLGTDTFTRSAAVAAKCPFTGDTVCLVPALAPDVAAIHVHEADRYGNCRLRGTSVADLELARAAKRVIITCERLIPTEEIRREPWLTAIPFFCVDAVCEVPFGSYPGNMPGEYFSDEDHLRQWLEVEKDPAELDRFLCEYIYNAPDFNGYLQRCGGQRRLSELRRQELLLDRGQ